MLLLDLIKRHFGRIQPTDLIKTHTYEAEIQAIQHEADLEYHTAMAVISTIEHTAAASRAQILAKMYRDRLNRLKPASITSVGTTKSS